MMRSDKKGKKVLIQCDFDGTITESDVSFVILDNFAEGNWRLLLDDYKTGKISVNTLNIKAFAMVKAGKNKLQKAALDGVKVRAGFKELINYCHERDFRLVIASNGMDFYIDAILKNIGIKDIEVFSGQTTFTSDGIEAKYVGPQGKVLTDGFKDSIVRSFINDGYQVIYAGNGTSDISPAGQCYHIFATQDLLSHCRKTDLSYTAFNDCHEIIKGLDLLKLDSQVNVDTTVPQFTNTK